MREKKYFIISSIIGIIDLIYMNFFNVKELINVDTESLGDSLSNVSQVINNPVFYYTLGIMGIIAFLIIIFIFSKNKESKYKNLLVTISIIIFLTSSNTIIMLISIINILLLRNVPGDTKEKKEMPILEKETFPNDTIKSLILIIIYLFVSFTLGDIITHFFTNLSNTFKILYNIGTDLFLLLITIILFHKELFRGFKILFKNIASYSSFLLKNYGLLLLANIVISFIIMLLNGEMITSQNQISINSLPLWYLLPASVIYAPIVEETVFRGCLRKLIKDDNLFIIISGACFGLLHTIGQEANIINTLVLALPYMAMGMVLAYTYIKSNNISTNIVIHSANNLLGCLIRLF